MWTKDGIQVSGARPKRTTKPHLSERMQKLVENRRQRVLVLRNGEHRRAGSVCISEGSLKNMLNDATDLLLFTVSNLYTIEGTKITEVCVFLAMFPFFATKYQNLKCFKIFEF